MTAPTMMASTYTPFAEDTDILAAMNEATFDERTAWYAFTERGRIGGTPGTAMYAKGLKDLEARYRIRAHVSYIKKRGM